MEISYDAWAASVARRVAFFNSTRYDEDLTDCPVCLGKGVTAYVNHALGSCYFTVRECDCMELLKQKDKLRLCGMPELVRRCSFQNFLVEAPWQKKLLETVQGCVDTDQWLMLCGQSGSGKSHLAAAVCRELIRRGQRVLCVSWPETVRRILSAGFEREQHIRPLLEAPVLLLDDLFHSAAGGGEVSRPELDTAFQILEDRSRRGVRTVLTTELLPTELRKLSESLHGRLVQMCREYLLNLGRNPALNRRIQS